eukprot:3987342-Prymnesium_polylepis.1
MHEDESHRRTCRASRRSGPCVCAAIRAWQPAKITRHTSQPLTVDTLPALPQSVTKLGVIALSRHSEGAMLPEAQRDPRASARTSQQAAQ